MGDSSKAGQVCPSQNDEERQKDGDNVFEMGDSSIVRRCESALRMTKKDRKTGRRRASAN